jgi:hypothetical protein
VGEGLHIAADEREEGFRYGEGCEFAGEVFGVVVGD